MYRDDSCSGGVTLLSFLTGTVIGAGIALLYAPKTGRETREMLYDYGSEFKDKTRHLPHGIRNSADAMIDRGKNLIERGKDLIEQGNSMVDQGKNFIDEKKQTLTDAIEAGKDAMRKEKEELTASLERED